MAADRSRQMELIQTLLMRTGTLGGSPTTSWRSLSQNISLKAMASKLGGCGS
jgi:hypothetical protein